MTSPGPGSSCPQVVTVIRWGTFNDHKQWRGLATRYDRLAAVYRGGVVLRAITIWLAVEETCPWGRRARY